MNTDLFNGTAVSAPTLSVGACLTKVNSYDVVARKRGVHHVEFNLATGEGERTLGVTLFPEEGEDVKTAQGYKAVNNLIWASKNDEEVALGHYLFTSNSRIRVGRVNDLPTIEAWALANATKQREYAEKKQKATLKTGKASANTQGQGQSQQPQAQPQVELPPEGDDTVF